MHFGIEIYTPSNILFMYFAPFSFRIANPLLPPQYCEPPFTTTGFQTNQTTIAQIEMPFLQGPKCIFAPSVYNAQPKLTVLIESSFVSSSIPLLLELLQCSLSAIDGSRDPLCSGSSYIRCSSSFLLDAPLSTSALILLKFVGASLPSGRPRTFGLRPSCSKSIPYALHSPSSLAYMLSLQHSGDERLTGELSNRQRLAFHL